MLDSGVLKAMLDIFIDYYMQLLNRALPPTQDDESFVLQIGNSLLLVLASRASQLDFHLKLYAFRALAVVCKVHPGFRSEKTLELIQHLTVALDWSPA